MTLALKKVFPPLYIFFKKFEKYMPASTLLWDKKKIYCKSKNYFNVKNVEKLA